MRKKSFQRQIRSYWNNMGQLWLSALGSGSRRFLGGRLVESVKDYVCLTRYPTTSQELDLSDRFQQYHTLLQLTQ